MKLILHIFPNRVNDLFFSCASVDAGPNHLQKEINILKTKEHWKKAYFYLWDEVILSIFVNENV